MPEALKKAGKKPGEIIVGGIDLAPATIDGLKSGYISDTLDQLLYMPGFMPVVQCVMSAKYKMPGLSLNTGAGVVTPKTIDALTKLIDAGIRCVCGPTRRSAGRFAGAFSSVRCARGRKRRAAQRKRERRPDQKGVSSIRKREFVATHTTAGVDVFRRQEQVRTADGARGQASGPRLATPIRAASGQSGTQLARYYRVERGT